jgi:hypothetical protein
MVAGIEAFVGKTAGSGFVAWVRWVIGRQIQITSPTPQQTLEHPQPLGTGVSYEVRGRLKKLPRDHRIWLLCEDERSGRVWPQGFYSIQFNQYSGEWVGRINGRHGSSGQPIKIVAVVAPPTAGDFFEYFQQVGTKFKDYEPLKRIPVECTNRTWVQARVP